MNVLKIILFLSFMFFLITIFAIKIIKNVSIQEALRIFVKFMVDEAKDMMKETSNVASYPVCIGWDGYRINPRIVEDAFSAMMKNFDVCCYSGSGYYDNGNLYCYKFKIMYKPESVDMSYFDKLIQKQAEEVLEKFLQQQMIILNTESMTFTDIRQDGWLIVYYAVNEEGIKRLDSYKQQKRMFQRKAVTTSHSEMKENWDKSDPP